MAKKAPKLKTSEEMKSNFDRFLKSHVKPATRDHRPRFSFEEAAERNIRVVALDFASGTSPNGIEPLIRPLPPAEVDVLLNKTEPWLYDAYYKDSINNSVELPSTRREEACSLYNLIDIYLTKGRDKNGYGECIIPDFTKWRAFGSVTTTLFATRNGTPTLSLSQHRPLLPVQAG